MKRLWIFFLILIFSGCPWGDLMRGSHDASYSALGETLSQKAVLPPSNIGYVVEPKNQQFNVIVTWDSVANAKEYTVVVSGNIKKTETTPTAEFVFPVTSDQITEGNFKATITVQTTNILGTKSVASAPVEITFGSDISYNGKVSNVWASRGTSTSIAITYSRADGADRYFLERRRSGDTDENNWKVVDSGIVNSDSYANQYVYYDQSALPGYRYDYRIYPVNSGGVRGLATLAPEGFVLPLVKTISASSGGLGKYDSNAGLLPISWEIQNCLLDADDKKVEDPELTALLKSTFEARVAAKANQINGVDKANFPTTWGSISEELKDFENFDGKGSFNSFDPTEGGWNATDMVLGSAAIYKKENGTSDSYRIFIKDTNPQRKEVSIQIRPVYGSSRTMPWSATSTGYVVSKEDADKGSVTELTVTPAGTTATLSWTGEKETDNWGVYLKKSGEPAFTLLEETDKTSTTVPNFSAGDIFGVAALIENGEEKKPGIIYEATASITSDGGEK